MLLLQMFSDERSFSILTVKIFPLESLAVYGIQCIVMMSCEQRLITKEHIATHTILIIYGRLQKKLTVCNCDYLQLRRIAP